MSIYLVCTPSDPTKKAITAEKILHDAANYGVVNLPGTSLQVWAVCPYLSNAQVTAKALANKTNAPVNIKVLWSDGDITNTEVVKPDPKEEPELEPYDGCPADTGSV